MTSPTSPQPEPTAAPPDPWPAVSVIMPVLNEERHLAASVEQVLAQNYPGPIELILALGPSRDATDAVAANLAHDDPRVHTVRNPTGRTPQGLNAAISASNGSVIVRVDAHSEIPATYVTTAVRTLLATGADNVGGIMDAQGETDFERAVACAMKSRIGVGSAAFHVGGEGGEADTVYLGVFRREALARVGGYDEHFARAQDWEMNHRIRATGGRVWFTPDLVVIYRPRSSVQRLAKQYYQYGRWRRVVARRHEGTMNLRYLAPPAMVVGTAVAAVLGLKVPVARLVPLAYAAGVVVGGLAISRDEEWATRVRVPAVLATMHWSWGWGFLTSPDSLAHPEGRADT
ncbi:glycosyltransferase family 2 protein [Kribbia dieselivorans]|uniref:glycosyltransferase family 2 protein n=1 Tax=Kribbia dieselivorans TaxID=331526 RepID=UPI0024805157|nr:glycosyltransferase family 2 protein [Kribbia dieselivorans]